MIEKYESGVRTWKEQGVLKELIKKIHIYTGLLSFTILLIFGVIGVAGSFHGAPKSRSRPKAVVTHIPHTVAPDMTDRQLADAVFAQLDTPFTVTPGDRAIRRDENNNLTFRLFSVNGNQLITVLEREGRVKIETRRANLLAFVNILHATTLRSRVDDLPVRLWKYYNEFSIWALIVMALSGVYLWVASRPRYRLAQVSMVAGGVVFAALYIALR